MKKSVSIILCIAFVISLFAVVPVIAAEPSNLLKNPELEYTVSDDGVYSALGWSKIDGITYEDGEDGFNTAVITVTNTDTYTHFGTQDTVTLDTDKFYKFSVQVKVEARTKDDGSTDFECLSWGNIRLVYQYNQAEVYLSEKITAKTDGWKELSFIMYGGDEDLAQKAWADSRQFAIKSQGVRAKISIRKPSVTVYETNEIKNIARIENKNLITNGDFSAYNADGDSTTTNLFTGFHLESKGTKALSHERVEEIIPGLDAENATYAAKISYKSSELSKAHFRDIAGFSKDKSYKLSMWIKVTENDDGNFTNESRSKLNIRFDINNDAKKKSVTVATGKCDWQYVEMTLDSSLYSGVSSVWQKPRAGIEIQYMQCNVYIANVKLEEFVGEVYCEKKEELLANGDFETYNEESGSFSNWTYYCTGNTASEIHYLERADGYFGNNAACLVSGDDTRNSNIHSKINIDPTKDYIFTAYIKTAPYKDTAWRCPSWGSVDISITTAYKILTMKTISSDRIDYVTDWMKISMVIKGDEIPDYTTALSLQINANQMRGLVYVDDVSFSLYTGGSISVNRTNAAAGDVVTVTADSDFDKVIAEGGLVYTYTDASSNTVSVDITEKMEATYVENTAKGYSDVEYTGKIYSFIPSSNQEIYQFTMPAGADVTVSAKFVEAALGDAGASVDFDDANHYRMDAVLEKIPATIEASVYLSNEESGAGGTLFSNYSSAVPGAFRLYITTGGRPAVYYVGESGAVVNYIFNTDIRTGDWAHLAFVLDEENDTASLYINGALFESTAISDLALINPCAAFCVGNNNIATSASFFKGHIRSLTLYSDIRTSEEIIADIEGVLPENDALVADYSFADGYDKNIEDNSPNGYALKNLGWISSAEPLDDYAYSFAVIGDTQIVNEGFPDKFPLIYDWILENKDAHNIQFMIGLGDITNSDTYNEYKRAKDNISRLNDIIPYSIIRGNHDYSFNNNFGLSSCFASQLDGYYGSSLENTYKIFTVGKVDYMIVTLDYAPTSAEVAWADELIASHPNHNVIITTHRYLNPNLAVDYSSCEQLALKHENVVMVLSGHHSYPGILVKESTGINGNTVTQMLIDPQGLDSIGEVGATGMIAMFYFSEDGKDIQVRFYSPIQDKYYNSDAQFAMTLDTVEYRYGDVNDDAEINVLDMVRLKKVVAKEDVKYNKRTSDCNIDDVVDTLDLTSLRKKLINNE